MDQREIKSLLQEASNQDCSFARRIEIQCKFAKASAAMGDDGIYKTNRPESGFVVVLDSLYTSTILNCPESLPSLFPVFAIICGDREKGSLYADVDWSLV